MSAARQAFYLFSVLLALACSGWYFASSETKFRLDANTLLKTSDTVITHLTLQQFGANGQPVNTLRSPFIRHIPENNQHWIKTPHITIAQEGQGPWEINAQQATALYGGTKVILKDQVSIHQHPSSKNDEKTFTTEQITYFPKTKHAITSKAIVFKQPGHQVNAKGMKADLEKKHIELLNDARGSYVPSND